MPSLNSLTEDFFDQRPKLFDPDVPDLPMEDLKEMFRLDLGRALRQALEKSPGAWGVAERFEDPDAEISEELERVSITVNILYKRAFWKKATPGSKSQGALAQFRRQHVQAAVHRWIAGQENAEQVVYKKAYSALKNKDGSTELGVCGEIDTPFSEIVESVKRGIETLMDPERDYEPVLRVPVVPEDLRFAMRFAAPLINSGVETSWSGEQAGDDPATEAESTPLLSFREILNALRDTEKGKGKEMVPTLQQMKEAERRFSVPFGIFSDEQRTLVVRAAFLLASEMPYQRFSRYIAAYDQQLKEAAEESPPLLVKTSLRVLAALCTPAPTFQGDPSNTAITQDLSTGAEEASSAEWEHVVNSGVSDQDDSTDEDDKSGPVPDSSGTEGGRETESERPSPEQSGSRTSREKALIPASLDLLRLVGGVSGVDPGSEAVRGWSFPVLEETVREWAGAWLPGRAVSNELLGRTAGALPLSASEGTGAPPRALWYTAPAPWNPVGRDIADMLLDRGSRARPTDNDLHLEALSTLDEMVRVGVLRAFVRKLIRAEYEGKLFEDRGVLSTNAWLKGPVRDAFKGVSKKAAAGYSRQLVTLRSKITGTRNPVYEKTVKQLGTEAVDEALGGQPLRPYGLSVLGEKNDPYQWNSAGIPLPDLTEEQCKSVANRGWTRYVTSASTPAAQYIRRALEWIVTAEKPLAYHPINTQAMDLCDEIAGEALHQAAKNLQDLENYVREQRQKRASFRGVKPLDALRQAMGLDPEDRPTPELETAHLLYHCLLLDALTLAQYELINPDMFTD